ncbi:MAG: hypothetical protein QOE92_585 [Chloroflexota bacterium]|nr:hypothetical protein [Chloroflexota bacterium]
METVLAVAEGIAGAIVVFAVLLDIFNGVIVPRPTVRGTWLSRNLTRRLWRVWRTVGSRTSDINKRESVLAIYPPAALVVILGAWVTAEVVGFGLLVHSLRNDFGNPPSLVGSMYVSAATLFSVGQAAHAPLGPAARLLVPAITGTGLATMALVVTFLFSLYSHFQRRETLVVTLDARAGAPPSGVTILETHARLGMEDRLTTLFHEWEHWSAEVLDSHLAYPILTYFRSSHDNESWISALGAMLDAGTLVVAAAEEVPQGPAKMLVMMGSHLVEDLAHQFGLDGEESVGVEREEFEDALGRLAAAGLRVRSADEAWEKFSSLRLPYASRLNSMAQHWATPPAQWIGDRSPLHVNHHPERVTPAPVGPAAARRG